METIIIGGDARFEHLARLLSERGESVGVYGREAGPWADAVDRDALGRAKTIVVNCPPRAKLSLKELLGFVPGGARVICCGPGHPDITDARLTDLWSDEALLLENARLTAEGALASAMRASNRALAGMDCMVVGWGRIGRSLTELLVALGARVKVASRTASGRNRAVERGAEAADTARIADALPGRKLVFNTALLCCWTLRRSSTWTRTPCSSTSPARPMASTCARPGAGACGPGASPGCPGATAPRARRRPS